jgi:hypothetical protein
VGDWEGFSVVDADTDDADANDVALRIAVGDAFARGNE